MKKIILLMLICVVSFSVLVSCHGGKHLKRFDISYPINVHAIIKFDGGDYEADISVGNENDILISFSAPDNLKNTALKMKDGQCYIIVYGIELPINDGGYAVDNGLFLARHIFSLSQRSYTDAEVVRLSGVEYCVENYDTRYGRISAYFTDGGNFPKRISARLNGHELEILIVN
jgi:hypothetical protein